MADFKKLQEDIQQLSIQIHECVVFEKLDEVDKCVCGLTREDHVNIQEEKENYDNTIRWERSSDTQTAGPTDAYGNVIFNGRTDRTAEYLRLSFDTGRETFQHIIENIWCLKKPELALFIIGECDDDSIRFVDTFIETALLSDKFVITEGCNAGVAKILAEKAAKINKGTWNRNKLKILGVAHWATLRNRECLLNDIPGNRGRMEKYYQVDICKEDKSSLDPNHTHFLLVDDAAYRKGISDGAINLVAKFLSEMGAVVTVAFDEKVNTIKTIIRNIQYGIPCIMITKTNKFTSLFDYALVKLNGQENKKDIETKFQETFLKEAENEDDEYKRLEPRVQERYYKKILDSFLGIAESQEKRKLVVQLDPSILQDQLKSNIMKLYVDSLYRTSTPNPAPEIQNRLNKFIMKWGNNASFQDQRIVFVDEPEIPEITDALLTTLVASVVGNNLDFVKLLLKFRRRPSIENNSGFSLSDLLEKLSTIKSDDKKIENISQKYRLQLKGFLGELFSRSCCRSNSKKKAPRQITKETDETKETLEKIIKEILGPDYCNNNESAEPALANKLYLIACVFGSYETSLYLASVDDYPLANYLVGVKIFKYIKSIHLSGSMQRMIDQAIISFEQAACNLFESVYAEDELKAYQMLFVQVPQYNNTNCIKLAEWAKCLDFLSIKAVTCVFRKNYFNSDEFISFLLGDEVCEDKNKPNNSADLEANNQENGADRASSRETEPLNSTNVQAPAATNPIKPTRKPSTFLRLFQMPFVKFILYYISFFTFLILFGYMLVAEFYPYDYSCPKIVEILVLIWVSAFTFDGIYIIVIKSKLKEPYRWNCETIKFVLANPKIWAVFFYVIGFILRMIPSCYNCYLWARAVLSFDFLVWTLELFEGLKSIKKMGILFVMIRKMSTETLRFVLLLVIIMFAYGVSTQALLYPNQEGSFGHILGNIFLPSFFVIVGNDFSFEKLITFGNCPYNDSRDTEYRYTNDLNDKGSYNCPDVFGSKIAMFLHIVYLIILAVILLNLLIAILNNIYTDIQTQSEKQYNLLFVQHSNKYRFLKTPFPPPLNLLLPVLFLIRRNCFNNKKWIESNRYNAQAILTNVDQEKLIGYQSYYDALYSPKPLPDFIYFTGFHAEKVFWKLHKAEKNKEKNTL